MAAVDIRAGRGFRHLLGAIQCNFVDGRFAARAAEAIGMDEDAR